MNENYIMPGIITITLIEYFWELYLSVRQHTVYKSTKSVPKELENSVNKQIFDRSREYALDKSIFGLISDFYNVILSMGMIYYYVLLKMWQASKSISNFINLSQEEMTTTAVFMVLAIVLNTVVSLPLNVYNTFVIEEKHGFNKQTVEFFIRDKIKSLIVLTFITVPLSCGAVYIIQIGGDFFFIYLWLFSMAVLLFLMTVYPDYIAPLFDKYTPLPEGELRSKIEALAESLEFPLYKLYLVEGSKRSVHSNAYFYGFFKNKRIVLFDTLLKDKLNESDKGCDDDEILAVLSHEFGHWKFNHVFKNILIMQVNLFLQFFAFGFLFKYSELYRAFGFISEEPVIIGLIIILQYIFSLYHSVTNFFLTILSRKFEFQADTYAKSLGNADALQKSLIKLHKDNLSFPVYDWLYSMWHHSHPPLLQRLEALKKTE